MTSQDATSPRKRVNANLDFYLPMNSTFYDTITRTLGFPQPVDVRGRLSIADLFPRSKRRTGIYLLVFANDTFYIGQAVDVCRRFAQHRASVGDIAAFSFRAVRCPSLDSVERDLIQSAEAAALPLTNRVHVSNILGETDLDVLVKPSSQEDWLQQWPRPTAPPQENVTFPPNAPARIRTSQAFQRLRSREEWPEVRSCLRAYCSSCVPYPAKTQLSFWAISCLPSTNKNTWPRFAAVNAGIMEMLVLGWSARGAGRWGFVNVAKSALLNEFGSIAKFQRLYNCTAVDGDRGYRSAGADQVQIAVNRIADLTKLFEVPGVRNAASQLMLRVMRSRATIYGRFHCPALADQILEPPSHNDTSPYRDSR